MKPKERKRIGNLISAQQSRLKKMYETRFLRSIYIKKDQNLVKLHEIIENTLIDAGKSKTLACIIKQSQK